MQLLVFDQTRAPEGALGPWVVLDADLRQLVAALGHPVGARHMPTIRLYDAESRGPHVAPSREHALHWGSDPAGLAPLTDATAEARLASGVAIQVYVFNGDADCVRHHLVLPLPPPRAWLP